MQCPKCGADGAVRNGNGRGVCFAGGRHSFYVPAEYTPEEVEEATLARQGIAPDHNILTPLPLGQKLKGVSTLTRNPAGELQWVKTNEDDLIRHQVMLAAIQAMGEALPRQVSSPPPQETLQELLNCYVITDFHLGMLSWHEETGADWDTKIAEDMLVRWFAMAIEKAPDAEIGVFAQLGDFMHWDGMDAVTPASKHLLDADGRFQKLVRTAIRAIRRVVDMLLAKHRRVHLLAAEGNHDPASSIWMREWLAAIYEEEPRITVDLSPDPYYCYEWGQTSLFFHHGHKKRPNNIDDVFVAKFREVFGRTKYSYAHMGHLHHIDQKETNLMVVEQHRTLASPDAYASRGGWISGRDAQVITYSKRLGDVGRVRISADMVYDHAS